MKYYTGVGSRQTPSNILSAMTLLADWLERKGYILRSGGADGADSAFEKGVHNFFNKEIYLPWQGFNGNNSTLYHSSLEAFNIARSIHPAWHKCSDGAKKLHARNVHQVLGRNLNSKSDFVVCWTENGVLAGGTATAIRLAIEYHIPVFNFGNYDSIDESRKDFLQFFNMYSK